MTAVCTLLAFGISLTLAQDKPVSFSCGATRVPVILKRLSEENGVDLRSTADLEDEVLFISVKSTPLRELIAEIADVAHASWQPRNGIFYLTRPAKQVNQDETAETALNLTLLRRELAHDLELGRRPVWSADDAAAKLSRLLDLEYQLKQQVTPEAGFALDRAKTDSSPGNRGVARLFAAAGPSAFADVRPWQLRVYTVQPNSYQLGLPDSVSRASGDFVREEQYVRSRLNGLEGNAMREMAQNLGINPWYVDAIQEPVVPVVKTQPIGAHDLSFDVLFCDESGRAIEEGYRYFSLDSEPDLTALDGLSAWGEAKIAWSQTAKHLVESGSRGSRYPSDPNIVGHPLSHDPLGLAFDDALQALASAANRDVVAALPDECLHDMLAVPTVAEFCKRLGRWVSYRNVDGRLLIAPIRSASAYHLRARRAPLDGLLALCRRQIPLLDDAAAYALAQNEKAVHGGLESEVLGWNQCTNQEYEALGGLHSPGYRSRLMLCGLLTAEQKWRMVSGGILYRNLTAEQKQLVARWLYESQPALQYRMSQAEQLAATAEARRGVLRSTPVLDREPTFALPAGVPQDALISLNEEKQRAAEVVTAGGRKYFEDCQSIGYIASRQERGEWLDPRMGYPLISTSKMAPVWRRTLSFTIGYTPKLSETYQLSDAALADPNYVTVGKLPADWLKPVNDTLAEYRKIFKDMSSSQQTSPP